MVGWFLYLLRPASDSMKVVFPQTPVCSSQLSSNALSCVRLVPSPCDREKQATYGIFKNENKTKQQTKQTKPKTKTKNFVSLKTASPKPLCPED